MEQELGFMEQILSWAGGVEEYTHCSVSSFFFFFSCLWYIAVWPAD